MANEVVAANRRRDVTSQPGAEADERVFVTLYVNNQMFGVPVLQVQDILVPESVARIPLAPKEVAGAINLRGRIVTVINMRHRLGLPPFDAGQKRMCATVEYGNDLYSLLVDAVGEVLTLPSRRVETNPNNLSANWREVSAGVIRLDKELVVVLDIDRLLQTLVH